MPVKVIAENSAKKLKREPAGNRGVRCKTQSGRQYLIIPAAGRSDDHVLWEQLSTGEWLEKARSESPAELSDLIDFSS